MRNALLVLSILLLGASADASPFDDLFEVYREDFVGESALPTSPEIDEMGAGGVVEYDGFPGLGPPPLLTGDALRLFTNGLAASQQRADAFPTTTIGTGSLGVWARFDGLEVSVLNDPVILTANAAFEADAGGVFYGVGVGVRLEPDPPNAPRVFLVLGESQFDPMTFPQITSRTIEFELGPADADLVLTGSFGIALTVFRSGSGTVYGELTDGEGLLRQGIGDLALSDFSTQAVERISASLTVEVGASTAQVDLTELAAFIPFTSRFTAGIGDGADANPGDGSCATATGACTLRAAIQEANAEPGPGRIELGEGEYGLSVPGTNEDAAATGDLDILDDLEIVGVGSFELVHTDIDANGLDRLFHVPESAQDRAVRLRNLRIRGGFAASAQDDSGGGIATWGRTTLDRVLVADNVASVGGGILNGGTLWLIDSAVVNNLAQSLFVDGRGGGLAGGSGDATSTWSSRTTILRSAILGNEATIGGSGVDFHRAAQADIRSSTIAMNLGTGVHSFNSPLVLDHSTLENDSGAAIEAVLAQGASSIRFIQSAVTGVPACALPAIPLFQSFYEGNNASNDASCGFSAPGSIENVDLLLSLSGPALPSTVALVPDPGSPLIDAGDPALLCPATDQAGTARPLDGDGNGSSLCDIGAIEVPEPGLEAGLLAGTLLLASLRRRSARARESERRPMWV